MAGLLGLGGISGIGGAQPPAGLLGPYFNPADMRKQQLKQLLLGAGIGLLTNGKGSTGEVLGQGLGAGLAAANNAGINYKNDAMGYQKLAQEQRDQQEREKQQKAVENWVSTLPPEQQKLAEAYPEQAAKLYMEQQMGGADKYFGTPLPFNNADQSFGGYGLPSRTGDFTPLKAPNGGSFLSPFDKSYAQSSGKAEGEITGKSSGSLPGMLVTANNTVAQIDSVLNDPNLGSVTGIEGWMPKGAVAAMTGGKSTALETKINMLRGQAFLSAFEMLRGGGQITEVEGQKATEAVARLDTAQNDADYKAALKDFRDAVQTGVNKLAANARQPAPNVTGSQPATAPLGGPVIRTWNPSTGKLE